MTDHTLSELVALTGLSARTIRYYVSQGLVPSPGREGPGTRYAEVALDRLRLIAKLRAAHLPLAEIRSQLAGLEDAEIGELAAANEGTAPAPSSALEYIRSILAPEAGPTATPRMAASMPAPPAPAQAATPWPGSAPGPSPKAGADLPSQPPEPSAVNTGRTGERSQWERLSLTSDIELHVRRPLSRPGNRIVERLVAFANQLLKEESK